MTPHTSQTIPVTGHQESKYMCLWGDFSRAKQQKTVCRFNANITNIPIKVFTEMENKTKQNLTLKWKHKRTQISKNNSNQEEHNQRNFVVWLQTILQNHGDVHNIKLVQGQKCRSMEDNRKARMNLHSCTNTSKKHSLERAGAFKTSGASKTRYIPGKRN